MENEYSSMQLINGKGDFNEVGLEEFMQRTKLFKCGFSYAVVAIMGPQSSGKSTLLNHMFHTNFREMDASQGRNQTTEGIWMEECAGVEPFTVVMDLEGTDGSERGEDDTAFDKQSALFALAIADIVIVNMWCHDVGREHGANKPLLRTVFQVMMNIFGARRTTLLFVLRDKTKTPLHHLERTLKEEAKKIWDSVRKPASHNDTPLCELFNVEVVALSSYEQNEDLFEEEVAQLRQRLLDSIAGDRQDVVPASGFSLSAQNIWKSIKENKDLDLLSHKVLVATICCEEIVNEKLYQLSSNEDWLALERAIQSGQPAAVSTFGSKLGSILETCFGEYDREALHFNEGVRNEKRKVLESKALDFVHPTHLKLLEHLHLKALEKFKSSLKYMLNKGVGLTDSAKRCGDSVLLEIDKKYTDATITLVNNVKWDTSEAREKLFQDINSSKWSVREEILSKWKAEYEEGLKRAVAKPVESLFENPNKDTWAEIRKLLKTQTEFATSKLLDRVSRLELSEETINKMTQELRDCARNVVVTKARANAEIVPQRMKDRFEVILIQDTQSKRRKKKSIQHALAESLNVLSAMAAMRLDEKPDKIEEILLSFLSKKSSSSQTPAPTTWPEVSSEDTLITPRQCISLWENFQEEIETRTQAFNKQGGRVRGIIAPALVQLALGALNGVIDADADGS